MIDLVYIYKCIFYEKISKTCEMKFLLIVKKFEFSFNYVFLGFGKCIINLTKCMQHIHLYRELQSFDISHCGNYTCKDYTFIVVHALIFDEFSLLKKSVMEREMT